MPFKIAVKGVNPPIYFDAEGVFYTLVGGTEYIDRSVAEFVAGSVTTVDVEVVELPDEKEEQ